MNETKYINFIAELIPTKFKLNLSCLVSKFCFAPSNIALCKYWGKRDVAYNLPVTDSISISLGDKGTKTRIAIIDGNDDVIYLNNNLISKETSFSQRISTFLQPFRIKEKSFKVETISNIPIAAGFASSASGFAALTLAINDLFALNLPAKTLSIIARFGSGSACRSLWPGFVQWNAGIDSMGRDCYAEPLNLDWPEFTLGMITIKSDRKKIGSTKAMNICSQTSPFYRVWDKEMLDTIKNFKTALFTKDFEILANIAEQNSLRMHALMQSSNPPIMYHMPETIELMHQIWDIRERLKIPVYFTQDAGANLILIFLQHEVTKLKTLLPKMEVVQPISSVDVSVHDFISR
ncbi:MAG: diphosphomevalonate decarboxylase [Rickettsiaceae bacterium]|nr:diphosphomevalonate decarboxylase [Rickettsiaceae bacterium]